MSINARTSENLLTVFSAAHVVVWLQLPADGATSRSWATAWSSGCVDVCPGRTSCRTPTMSKILKSGRSSTPASTAHIQSDGVHAVNARVFLLHAGNKKLVWGESSTWKILTGENPAIWFFRSQENISDFLTKCFSPQDKPGKTHTHTGRLPAAACSALCGSQPALHMDRSEGNRMKRHTSPFKLDYNELSWI